MRRFSKLVTRNLSLNPAILSVEENKRPLGEFNMASLLFSSTLRIAGLNQMTQQPISQFRLKPGRFGRHNLMCVRDLHEIFNCDRVE